MGRELRVLHHRRHQVRRLQVDLAHAPALLGVLDNDEQPVLSPPEGAWVPASIILLINSSGTASGLKRLSARAEKIVSNSPISAIGNSCVRPFYGGRRRTNTVRRYHGRRVVINKLLQHLR